MSWNNAPLLFICAMASAPAIAAGTVCPSTLTEAGHHHALNNAALFDGSVEQMADLAPARQHNVDRWNAAGVDPYLVCKYHDTDSAITLHAKPARECTAGGTPYRAFCK